MRQPLSIWCKINGQMYRCYANQERGKTLENFTNPISHNTWFSGIMKIWKKKTKTRISFVCNCVDWV